MDFAYLCNEMAYLYGRCQKCVSLPAPLYYSHLFSERARFLVSEHVRNETGQSWLSDTSSISDNESVYEVDTMVELRQKVIKCANTHAKELCDQTKPMFYC